MLEYFSRRDFIKKSFSMGISLPFVTQIMLTGCRSSSKEDEPTVAEGSVYGGDLDGAKLAITTLASDTNSTVYGRIKLDGISKEIAFTPGTEIEKAIELMDQTDDTNYYRITLVDLDDQIQQAEAAVTELTDKFHIMVTANGNTITLDILRSVLPARTAGVYDESSPLKSPLVIFAVTVLIILSATLLFIAGQMALCALAGGTSTWTTSTVVILGGTFSKITFKCVQPTGGDGSGG